MQKLGEHILNPTTKLKVGTLGKNGAIKGYNDPIPKTHAFNNSTGNDVFLTDEGFNFHTAMNLNKSQRTDLKGNNNIL